MANNNAMVAKKPTFSMEIRSNMYQYLIKQTLGDPKRVERYTAAIMSAVATNPQLQTCEAKTILSGSLLAESLNLAHSPQLGHYYLVPFNNRKQGTTEAQFILGYKGYIQLAARSGNYKHINVMEIKEGELVSYNPFDEEIILNPIQDVDEREKTPTIGYYAMFEYTNGFKKVIYWSKAQMLAHADKYSKAFSVNATRGKYPKVSYADYAAGNYNKDDEWLYSSFWYKDFDSMAKKTMLRQLISKWGVMSVDMTQAIETDNSVIKIDKGNFAAEIPESENLFDDNADVPEDNTEPETNDPEEVNFDEL